MYFVAVATRQLACLMMLVCFYNAITTTTITETRAPHEVLSMPNGRPYQLHFIDYESNAMVM